MVKIQRANRLLLLFGLLKIRLIYFVNPKIVELDAEKVVVRIRNNWKTRNHLGSMYFGVMAVGADIAGGFLAFLKSREGGSGISLAFKDFTAEFIKRPESHVYFECKNAGQIERMMTESSETRRKGDGTNQDTRIHTLQHRKAGTRGRNEFRTLDQSYRFCGLKGADPLPCPH